MALRPLLAALVLLVIAAPMASAHNQVKRLDNEVHILSDFADDIPYEVGGWDLWDIYLGEAHLAGVGDGFYFRLILYGDFSKRMPGETEYRATFTAQGPKGAITKSVSTKDGKTFTTDFDALQTKIVGTDVEVVRGFVSLEKAGLAPGMELKGFKVETFVGTELRDRAPGGYFAPGTKGGVEKPETSTVKAASYKLSGPTAFIKVTATTLRTGRVSFAIENLFKEESQLVSLRKPAAPTWTFDVAGEGTAQIPGGKASSIQLALTPKPDAQGFVQPAPFDITSDLGGRVGFVAVLVNAQPTVVREGEGVAAAKSVGPAADAPGLDLGLLLVGLLGVALALRRRPT